MVVSSATGLAGADAGVVDQHVEAAEALAVRARRPACTSASSARLPLTALDVETRRRAGPRPPPRASPDAAPRPSGRGPPRPARGRWPARCRSTLLSRSPLAAPCRAPPRHRRMWRGIPSVVPRLGRRASTSLVPRGAARRRRAARRLRRLRQARQPTPAARADRPAGRLPRGERQDAQRPRLDGRRPGADPGAQRLAAAQGDQPLRLRALRHRPQADHRRRGGALHGAPGRLRRRGPYVARSESLAVKPQFQSQTRGPDSDAAKSVYVADVPFKRNGKQAVVAIAKLDGRLLVTNGYGVNVTPRDKSGAARRGREGDPRPHPDADRRRRRRRRSSTRAARRQGPPADRPRRRGRQAARRRHVRDAAAVREPRLRPGRRHRRAGQGDRAQGRGLHPPGDLQGQQGRQGRALAGRGVAAAPASRGRSSSTARARSRARFEGAFSVGELQRAVDKVA